MLSLSLMLASGCASRMVQTDSAPARASVAGDCGNHKRVTVVEAKGGQALVELETRRSEELTLPSESQIPDYEHLVRIWEALPQKVHFEPTWRNGVSARVAIRETAGREKGTVYVCIPGLFGNGGNFKYIVGAFEGENEFWTIDPPGSGLSDCPDPAEVGPGGYGPDALAERILQALEARLAARPDVSRIVLVGHSLGGMVAMRMFMNDDLRPRYRSVLGRVKGMTLFAPADVLVTQATDTWTTFFGIDGFKAGVGSALQIVQYKIVNSLRESFCNPKLVSRELAESGIRVICSSELRESTKAMMRDAVEWTEFMKTPNFQVSQRLEQTYRNVTIPCLIVWGKCDKTLPEATGYKIMHHLPDARLVVIPETMHLVTLERPQLCADLIRQFESGLEDGSVAAANSVRTVEPAGLLARAK